MPFIKLTTGPNHTNLAHLELVALLPPSSPDPRQAAPTALIRPAHVAFDPHAHQLYTGSTIVGAFPTAYAAEEEWAKVFAQIDGRAAMREIVPRVCVSPDAVRMVTLAPAEFLLANPAIPHYEEPVEDVAQTPWAGQFYVSVTLATCQVSVFAGERPHAVALAADIAARLE